ncbi:hypothetical protein B484DRAFT_449448 [Ochromonadaceae sp. CCMP2298]|nr:hypothetical protein B484DRAFT_449448 [Ochromonadaceae sp. CCMP2298]|mmetsp:Transcript_6486/g.14305  ORF Transcript_6486/g.14305 Transcript_6486/m.14305 type:complete len:196 (-) Transcript_6486:38-625(-)|eukprot:CAMPEP_0173244420 /NCGR_PEP_ID=MMETSP1142-20121109/16087_1 /TAXON_ID=483371 /ORGANISM="non described non described, Strain CCMP2298" /LENGTH=195 /DNA_ID=CAMNT_0014176201 /DNA_START=178 /DNA_END=765 /DNA_ORIENTATION=+
MLRVLLLVALFATVSAGLLSRINIFGKRAQKERTLLPKLLPHEDNQYIIEFVTDNSEPCEQMDAVVERLEKDLNLTVRRVNINRRAEFYSLFECTGGTECGTVPFFYNRRTAQAICGATPYKNLKKLATGSCDTQFHDAPQNLQDRPDYDPRRQRGTGIGDFFSQRVQKNKEKKEGEGKEGKEGKKGKGKEGEEE